MVNVKSPPVSTGGLSYFYSMKDIVIVQDR